MPKNLDDIVNELLQKLYAERDRANLRLVANYDKELLKHYLKSDKVIKQKIADMFERYGGDVQYSDMLSYNRLTNLENEIALEIKRLTGITRRITEKAIKDIYAQSYYYGGYAMEAALKIKLGFGQLNPRVVEAALFNPMDRIKWTERHLKNQQTYMQQIREEITQGLIQGKGYASIARSVKTRSEIGASKLIRIVRTETHRAQTMGSLAAQEKTKAAAERLGIKIEKIWVATLDNLTRDDHGNADGQAADDDGYFWLGAGIKTLGPGLSGIPEQDIHCRCTERIRIEGLTFTKRKDNVSKEVIDYIPYNLWKIGNMG